MGDTYIILHLVVGVMSSFLLFLGIWYRFYMVICLSIVTLSVLIISERLYTTYLMLPAMYNTVSTCG